VAKARAGAADEAALGPGRTVSARTANRLQWVALAVAVLGAVWTWLRRWGGTTADSEVQQFVLFTLGLGLLCAVCLALVLQWVRRDSSSAVPPDGTGRAAQPVALRALVWNLILIASIPLWIWVLATLFGRT
jgi:drug/metabolite transporter (DMT)-like permease